MSCRLFSKFLLFLSLSVLLSSPVRADADEKSSRVAIDVHLAAGGFDYSYLSDRFKKFTDYFGNEGREKAAELYDRLTKVGEQSDQHDNDQKANDRPLIQMRPNETKEPEELAGHESTVDRPVIQVPQSLKDMFARMTNGSKDSVEQLDVGERPIIQMKPRTKGEVEASRPSADAEIVERPIIKTPPQIAAYMDKLKPEDDPNSIERPIIQMRPQETREARSPEPGLSAEVSERPIIKIGPAVGEGAAAKGVAIMRKVWNDFLTMLKAGQS